MHPSQKAEEYTTPALAQKPCRTTLGQEPALQAGVALYVRRFRSLTLRAIGMMGGPDITDVWVAQPQDLFSL